MTRFAWMQARSQVAVAAGALVIAAVILVITGLHLSHLYDTTVATCQSHADCPTVTSSFLQTDHTLATWLDVLVVAVPGIMGIFWGAPLVARELETGSFRLAWTQSVTRRRWLAVKLAVAGLAAVAVAGLLSLMVTWWSSPLDRVNMYAFGSFDERDIVPLGYAAFAFVLGVTAGVLIRRTLPAMATTLVVFVAVRLAAKQWIRPNFMSPKVLNGVLNAGSMGFGSTNGGPFVLEPQPSSIPGAWILSTQIVDKAGHGLTAQHLKTACPQLLAGTPGGGGGNAVPVPAGAQRVLQDCVVKLSAQFHQLTSYQPASRYWTFQADELAVYLAAALVLAGVCFWWVRRRLA